MQGAFNHYINDVLKGHEGKRKKMPSQLYVVQGIVAGRARREQDPVWLREVELARDEARAERRAKRGRL